VIAAIDQRDPHICVAQRLGGGETTKAAADDHDVRKHG